MNDIHNRTWSDCLEIFEEYSSMTPIGVGRVDTFRGKVCEFLEVCVPKDPLVRAGRRTPREEGRWRG